MAVSQIACAAFSPSLPRSGRHGPRPRAPPGRPERRPDPWSIVARIVWMSCSAVSARTSGSTSTSSSGAVAAPGAATARGSALPPRCDARSAVCATSCGGVSATSSGNASRLKHSLRSRRCMHATELPVVATPRAPRPRPPAVRPEPRTASRRSEGRGASPQQRHHRERPHRRRSDEAMPTFSEVAFSTMMSVARAVSCAERAVTRGFRKAITSIGGSVAVLE